MSTPDHDTLVVAASILWYAVEPAIATSLSRCRSSRDVFMFQVTPISARRTNSHED